MSISVQGLGGAFDPEAMIGQLLADYTAKREATLQALLDAGIAKERISIITRDGCPECHGRGSVDDHDRTAASYVVTLRDCRTCPGICVDGVSARAHLTQPPPRATL